MATMLGTAFAGLTAGGGALQALSIASTVVGGIAALSAGAAEKQALYNRAEDEEIKASQEVLKGREDAVKAMQRTEQLLAQNAVAGFASGLEASGSVVTAQEEAMEIGDRNLATSRENAQMAVYGRRSQASQYRVEGDAAARTGMFKALGGVLGGFSRFAARG